MEDGEQGKHSAEELATRTYFSDQHILIDKLRMNQEMAFLIATIQYQTAHEGGCLEKTSLPREQEVLKSQGSLY